MNNNVIIIPPGISNQYLVKGTKDYLLIDTGLSANYTKLTRFLTENGISGDIIDMIAITHADGDHFGCLDHLLTDYCPKANSAASKIEAESIKKGVSSRPMKTKGVVKLLFSLISPLFISKPARISRILVPGDILPYLGGLQVLDTNGHTPGHISLWSKSTKSLFCGDSIKLIGGVLSPSSGANTWDEGKARKSFELQMDLMPDFIYGGHCIWTRKQ